MFSMVNISLRIMFVFDGMGLIQIRVKVALSARPCQRLGKFDQDIRDQAATSIPLLNAAIADHNGL